jgi:hypothetical protein
MWNKTTDPDFDATQFWIWALKILNSVWKDTYNIVYYNKIFIFDDINIYVYIYTCINIHDII